MNPVALVCPSCGDDSKQRTRSTILRGDWLRGIGILVISVAVGVAGGAMYVVVERQPLWEVPEAVPQRKAPVDTSKVTVLAAKRDLEMHTGFGRTPEDFFVEIQCSKDDAPKAALGPMDLPKLKGKYLKRELAKGDPVTAEDLMDPTISLKPLGGYMRAVGLRVSSVEGSVASIARLPGPGDHVDILWISHDNRQGRQEAKILLEDVIILAMDPADGELAGYTVYVAVSLEDVSKAMSAMETGSLRMVPHDLDSSSRRNWCSSPIAKNGR
jgi:Flp pilus assembly protein CpaB